MLDQRIEPAVSKLLTSDLCEQAALPATLGQPPRTRLIEKIGFHRLGFPRLVLQIFLKYSLELRWRSRLGGLGSVSLRDKFRSSLLLSFFLAYAVFHELYTSLENRYQRLVWLLSRHFKPFFHKLQVELHHIKLFAF